VYLVAPPLVVSCASRDKPAALAALGRARIGRTGMLPRRLPGLPRRAGCAQLRRALAVQRLALLYMYLN
jgi:hypothetical protein